LDSIARLLVAARDLSMFNRPPRRDYVSVKSYFEQTPPVCSTETYIHCKEDIITLKPGRETAWLDDFIERVVQKLSYGATRVRPPGTPSSVRANLILRIEGLLLKGKWFTSSRMFIDGKTRSSLKRLIRRHRR